MSLAAAKNAARKVRFGSFEADLKERELRKGGIRVRLQQKPFQILEALLEAPGSLILRTDLANRLWPGLHVNFDRSLNTAVNALRIALGDSAQNPRYIETRPGLGYRFIAPVEQIGTPAASAGPPPAHAEAHQDYLRGRYFLSKRTEEDLHKSVAHFESAIRQDARNAMAYAGLADAYSMFAVQNMLAPKDAQGRAQETAAAALHIDPDLAEAHASTAGVKLLFDWDWGGAEKEHLRALELNPESACVRGHYATYLAAAGRASEALPELERARSLDPLSLSIHAEIAWVMYVAGDFAGAAEQSWKALAMEPRFAAAQHTLGLAYERMGMIEEAVVEQQNARVCAGDSPAVIAALAHAHSSAGDADAAAAAFEDLSALSQRRYVSHYWYAVAHAGMGNDEAALAALDDACRQRDVWMIWAHVDPRFERLRNHSQFRQIIPAPPPVASTPSEPTRIP